MFAIILGEREAIINGTPRKYAEIYTACWQGNPALRPHIHQVTEDLNNVDITDTIEDINIVTNQTSNELQNDDSLYSMELSFSAQINSLENNLRDLDDKANITNIIEDELQNDDLLYSTELPLSA
ncbi:16220_t:CDS:2 [Entrophospora sp. SA101]|nr:16220_t:CDS:2 [Entrophospora sp. SA101]